MGKWLVKVGLKLQAWWKKFCCGYNRIVSLFLINVSDDCPYRICKCKS